jgi:hypothetical protein
MSRLLLVCLSAIVCFLVCCSDKDKIPEGVLPKDKMQMVLWDMIQAERFRESFIRDSSKDLKAETFKLYAQVFEIHKISKDEFVKSYKFYIGRPDIARVMFDSLATKANRRREEMYKPKPLDTANVKQQSIDSAKKANSQPDSAKKVVPPPDSIKKALLPSVMPAPVLPKSLNPGNRLKRTSSRHLKIDSLRRLKFKH